MIRDVIDIKPYNWRVYVYLDASLMDAREILNRLDRIGIGAAEFMRAERHVMRAARNSGMTYSFAPSKESVMVVGHSTSSEETINTFSHELRHLSDDISKALNIPTRGEEVAYLTGNIAIALASSLLNIVCDCPVCNKSK